MVLLQETWKDFLASNKGRHSNLKFDVIEIARTELISCDVKQRCAVTFRVVLVVILGILKSIIRQKC